MILHTAGFQNFSVWLRLNIKQLFYYSSAKVSNKKQIYTHIKNSNLAACKRLGCQIIFVLCYEIFYHITPRNIQPISMGDQLDRNVKLICLCFPFFIGLIAEWAKPPVLSVGTGFELCHSHLFFVCRNENKLLFVPSQR